MEKEFINKKRNVGDINNSDSEEDAKDDNVERQNLPKKSQYRMRAHCNPLAEVSIP